MPMYIIRITRTGNNGNEMIISLELIDESRRGTTIVEERSVSSWDEIVAVSTWWSRQYGSRSITDGN